jgi:hypothetical protein
MKFFDKDFLKFTFQFLAMVFLGILAITYISSLNFKDDVTAGVVEVE